MAFKEFGNYDAVGLAELVRKKEVTEPAATTSGVAVSAICAYNNYVRIYAATGKGEAPWIIWNASTKQTGSRQRP